MSMKWGTMMVGLEDENYSISKALFFSFSSFFLSRNERWDDSSMMPRRADKIRWDVNTKDAS